MLIWFGGVNTAEENNALFISLTAKKRRLTNKTEPGAQIADKN